jgi:hypothetical protein
MKIPRSLVVLASLSIVAMTGTAPVQGADGARLRVVPVAYTPWLLPSPVDQRVQKLALCNGVMYAVGSITAVGQGGHTYIRSNAFGFNAATGAVTSWHPYVNGMVHAITMSRDCSTAYLGGTFTKVNATAATDLVAVDTHTGVVKRGFAHDAAGTVQTLQRSHGQVIAGGRFLTINGVTRPHLVSLKPTTGAVTPYLNLPVSGAYPGTGTEIYNSQTSHAGDRMLIEGVFTSVGGRPRQQVAMLDLGARSVTVDRWHSKEFDRACYRTFYVRAAAWSPRDAAVYVVTTGYRPVSGPGSVPTDPRSGLCDAAAAFPSVGSPAVGSAVTHKWVNYAGCDSYYAVVADAQAVYVGGHERWADNRFGCDAAGPGAVARPGLGSLNPDTGRATSWNPTRARGHGADDMLLTRRGLWIASDTWVNGKAQQCGGRPRHGGICFLPS